MQIAGSQFLFEQNSRLRDSLLSQQAANVANVQSSAQVSSDHTSVKPEEEDHTGASLKISGDGVKAATRNAQTDTATSFAPTDFSTGSKPTEETAATNGNSVLNQYRFFVQSAQYEGAEGTVRRIS